MSERARRAAREEPAPSPPRKELKRPLTVLKVWPEEDKRTFFGYAGNVSRGGLRVDATSPREPESRHLLEIPLPTGPAQCSCEVVWKRGYASGAAYPPAMGLRFLDLPDEDSDALDDWIHRSLGLWRSASRRSET